MTIDTQEFLALCAVIIIAAIALFRFLRKKNSATNACSGCTPETAQNRPEKSLHFFKKQR